MLLCLFDLLHKVFQLFQELESSLWLSLRASHDVVDLIVNLAEVSKEDLVIFAHGFGRVLGLTICLCGVGDTRLSCSVWKNGICSLLFLWLDDVPSWSSLSCTGICQLV
jgi:hypothetical protein